MSDKTPESSNDDGLEPAQKPAEDAAGGSTAARRRTSPAPVRKTPPKGQVRPLDPQSDDEVIEELDFDADHDDAEPAGRKTAQAPVKKAKPTPKRRESQTEEHDPYGPTTPVNFVKQSAGELSRVVWPTWNQLIMYFLAVLVFVLFIIAYVLMLDFGFGWALLSLFGDSDV